jgi:glucose-6-phosphate isomerase
MPEKKSSKDIIIDYSHVMAEFIGRDQGLQIKDLKEMQKRAARIQQDLTAARKKGKLAFAELPYNKTNLPEIRKTAKKVQASCDNFVVLGIGGSALGTRALISALCPPYQNLLPRSKRKGPKIFVADNVDPDQFTALLNICPPQKTIFNVISKSGTTAETMSQFLIVRDMLIKKLGRNGYRKRMIATTDPEKGILREIAERDNLASLPVPPSVGGRFSVLSPVGLFPAAVAGINISALLSGAAKMERRCRQANLFKNPASLLASILYLLYQRKKNIVVMMPYASSLLDLAEWFQQLWAESLGKKRVMKAKTTGVGSTPVRSLGVTDQHSQLQLYQDGPRDKVIIFIRPESFKNRARIPRGFAGMEGIKYLSGHSLEELILAEQQATEMAISKAGRPNLRINFPAIDAHALGQFMFLWEWTTAFTGGLLNVNPFDQPGVDSSKKYSKALLGVKGSGEMAKQVKEFFSTKKRHRI